MYEQLFIILINVWELHFLKSLLAPGILIISYFSHYNRYAIVSHHGFNFSLMATDFKHLFMCLFTNFIPPFMKYLCILPIFKLSWFVSLLLSFDSSLHILDISFIGHVKCKYNAFHRAKAFNFIRYNLSICFNGSCFWYHI